MLPSVSHLHTHSCFLVPVFCPRDGNGFGRHVLSLCLPLQKALSEMQAENQQRLKDREQELKDLKKMMDVMKVGQIHK